MTLTFGLRKLRKNRIQGILENQYLTHVPHPKKSTLEFQSADDMPGVRILLINSLKVSPFPGRSTPLIS